jgi:hypothetical protein
MKMCNLLVSIHQTLASTVLKVLCEAFPFINWEAITSNKKDLEQDSLNFCKNKTEDDLKEKNSQQEERLQVLLAEKEGMQLRGEELQKKTEITEAWLLQSSSKMWQTLAQIHNLKKDKEHSAQKVCHLKTTLAEMRSQPEEPFP